MSQNSLEVLAEELLTRQVQAKILTYLEKPEPPVGKQLQENEHLRARTGKLEAERCALNQISRYAAALKAQENVPEKIDDKKLAEVKNLQQKLKEFQELKSKFNKIFSTDDAQMEPTELLRRMKEKEIEETETKTKNEAEYMAMKDKVAALKNDIVSIDAETNYFIENTPKDQQTTSIPAKPLLKSDKLKMLEESFKISITEFDEANLVLKFETLPTKTSIKPLKSTLKLQRSGNNADEYLVESVSIDGALVEIAKYCRNVSLKPLSEFLAEFNNLWLKTVPLLQAIEALRENFAVDWIPDKRELMLMMKDGQMASLSVSKAFPAEGSVTLRKLNNASAQQLQSINEQNKSRNLEMWCVRLYEGIISTELA